MSTRRTECHAGGIFVQRRRLRDYMPHADGMANPWQWFAWRWSDDGDRAEREWLAGPLNTKRDLMAAIERAA